MPKLDLYNALQIKAAGGEVLQLKGPGFSWSKPTALTPFYRSGTIGIHLRSNGATPPGGPVTAIANEGGAGAPFNATTVGTPIPLTGNFLESTTSTGYLQTAVPAELVGVRLMWVMRMNVATGTYRVFGASLSGDVTYIRTLNNGTSIQLVRTIGGVTTSINLTGVPASTATRLFEIELGATARLFINGVLVADVANSFTTFRVDRLTQGPAVFQAFEGGMGDVLGVVTGQPDTADAIVVARNYLAQRFGITLPSTSWSFLNNIAGLSGYTINSRTADTIVFSRATTARSHLIFEWGLPTGTRLRFRYVKTGPALLWARTCDDTAGVNMAREIFGGSNSTSVDIVLNTRPYMGFLTASAQPADLTTYTIDQLIVDLP